MTARHWYSIPTPFSSSQDPVHHDIAGLSEAATEAGDRYSVVCAHNRHNDFASADLIEVDYSAHLDREYLTRTQILEDHLRGRLGLRRRWSDRLFHPAVEALEDADGPILVHKSHIGESVPRQLRRAGARGPIYLYFHNDPSSGYGPRELRAMFSEVNGVISVSADLQERIRARVGTAWTGTRFAVVHNAIDPRAFTSRAADRTVRETVGILFVGIMAPYKGPQVLLDALELLPVDQPFTATFVGASQRVVGAAPSEFETELRARAAQRFGDRVTFAGFQPHERIPAILADHDVLVVPSQFDEPFGLVLLEGMTSGLAVVATRRGGIPEVGADAIQYFTTARELADRLVELIEDPASRVAWGERAAERSGRFGWSRSFEELERFVAATT